MDLFLIRHGETVDNDQHVIQGHQPGKLSEYGIEQSKLTHKRLESEHFEEIYCSDLERAKEGLSLMIDDTSKVDYTPLLREKSFGKYEGKSNQEYEKDVKSSGVMMWMHKPEGGESLSDVSKRAEQFLDMLLNKYIESSEGVEEHKKVLVVSHRCFLNELLTLIKQKRGTTNLLIPGGFDPSSITIIRINKNNANSGSANNIVYDFISMNEVSHLNADFSP